MGDQFSFNLGINVAPERRIWKVCELTEKVRDVLEGEFGDFWIEGEVSNCRKAQSGHLYFTLKDATSQVRCVCFRDQARYLKFSPEDGLQVTARGSLSVYEARGEYQIYVTHIEPAGLGALQLAFEQLKKRLEQEGLFDPARKKPLPVLPLRIGVITSPQGAALRDILRVLQRRFPNLHVLIFPVRVQGEGTAAEIVRALRFFNRARLAEVIILARGGGSLEDLWAFNEEEVARAISDSVLPVITGVGHETDSTIADFVADVRAPTPSAAAEIVVRMRQEFERHIADYQRQIVQRMRYALLASRHHVRDLVTHRGFRRIEVMLQQRRLRTDDLALQLVQSLTRKLEDRRRRLAVAGARLQSFNLRLRAQALRVRIERCATALRTGMERMLARKRRHFAVARVRVASLDLRARVTRLRRTLEAKDSALVAALRRSLVVKRRRFERADVQLRERSPYQLLERGYAIAYDATGKVLRSPEQVTLGDEIAVRLARGVLDAAVLRKKDV
jgi:exodeoxyribonuclease VII large subunit